MTGTVAGVRTRVRPALRGVALVVAVAVPAYLLGRVVPVVGGPVLGVVLGVALSGLGRRTGLGLTPGIEAVTRYALPWAVVLLGAQVSIREALHVGRSSLPVLVSTLAACLAVGFVAGRAMGIPRDLRILISVGTGVCGASAIAAASPVLGASRRDVSYAMSTIFVFNVAAVLIFPALGHLLGLGQHTFGVFAGTAVNDTSSVVAAATSYGGAAANTAVVVKLTRSLTIIPICLVLAALQRRADRGETGARPRRGLVPWFLVGFVALATATTLGLVPSRARPGLLDAATLLITMALTAIGLSTNPRAIRSAGAWPLVLGLILWVTVAGTSLGVQALV